MSVESKLLSSIPMQHVRDLARHALQGGISEDEVIRELVGVVDELVDWHEVLGEPWASVLEKVDGPALRALVALVVHKVQRELAAEPAAAKE